MIVDGLYNLCILQSTILLLRFLPAEIVPSLESSPIQPISIIITPPYIEKSMFLLLYIIYSYYLLSILIYSYWMIVISGKDLISKNGASKSDPYVEVVVLDDQVNKSF